MNGICVNCGIAPVLARQRCRACYLYLHRTGRERPSELIERATQPHIALVPAPEPTPAEVEADLREYCQGVRRRREAGEAEPWMVTP